MPPDASRTRQQPRHPDTPLAATSPQSRNPARARRLSLGAKSSGPPMIDDLWYKNGVIYCLSVGTYMDANGDGIGDFKGLLRRLDYLSGLGVNTIWLLPFQPSPMRDDGYDVAD